MFTIITKHSPTSIQRMQRRKVGSAHQDSKTFAKRHVPHLLIRGPYRPKLFTSLTGIFNFLICNQQALWSSAFSVYIWFHLFQAELILKRDAVLLQKKEMKLNFFWSDVRHFCSCGLLAISWFPVFCSPAQFQSSYTSWQTSLLLNEFGAPSAQCVMPVGKILRHPMHLISIEHAHIWSAHRASSSMMDPLEQT